MSPCLMPLRQTYQFRWTWYRSMSCGTITKRVKTPVEDVGLDVEKNDHKGRLSPPVAILPRHRRTQTERQWRRNSLLCRKGSISRQTVSSQSLHKEDCSDDLLCYLCPKCTRVRVIGPVRHRSWTPKQLGTLSLTDESLM
ncbi:hypothetical protein AVEN_178813-1 [Araneus ventricosus]|uniref:Uncharacterized protein n=1 Tax=Araneus ventricosus TaxID=182803 RepID=A0A4Y2BF38_ARAVE|nr:hypothetical protein AVEN_178813-1 [Araneus ventricosus]